MSNPFTHPKDLCEMIDDAISGPDIPRVIMLSPSLYKEYLEFLEESRGTDITNVLNSDQWCGVGVEEREHLPDKTDGDIRAIKIKNFVTKDIIVIIYRARECDWYKQGEVL